MLVIAHRGASAFAQENTLQAFDFAFKIGSTWLETDVQRTKDGVLVLYHDYILKTGKEIKNSTFEYLKKYNVPTLTDLLKITPENFTLNLEIKNDNNIYPGIEEKLAACLKKHKLDKSSNLLISSFYLPSLKKIKKLLPDLKIGVLTKEFNLKEIKELAPYSVNMSYKRITRNIIKTCHAQNIKVLIYTVNDLKLFNKLKKDGVDAVFSDNPVLNQANFFSLGATL